MKELFKKEPAIIIGIIMSLIALLAGFGLKINGQQVDLIRIFLESILPLLGGIAIRTQVFPTDHVEKLVEVAVASPKGTAFSEVENKLEVKEEKIAANEEKQP